MNAHIRPTIRPSRGLVVCMPLTIAWVLMLVLGSMVSPLLPSAAAANVVKLSAQPAETVEVTVTVHWCPPGINPDTIENGEAIKPACTLQGPPINVALVRVSGNATVPMTRAISSFPGAATFVNVQPSTYALLGYHEQAEHTSGLFCASTMPDGTSTTYARLVEESPVDMVAGEVVTCDWFGELTGTSTVTLNAWNCEEGFDFATAGYDAAKQNCTEPVPQAVSFNLTNTAAIPPYEQTVEADPDVTQEDVPLGALTVTETLPQDYSLVAVVCTGASTVDPNQTTKDQDVSLTGANTFDLTIPSQGTLTCDVFHASGTAAQSTPMATPSVAGRSVTISTWECVPGTLTGQPVSYYEGEDQCEGEKPDVVLNVTDDTGTRQITFTEEEVHIDGLVGEVTITEMVPEGYETPAIFCSLAAREPGQQLTGSGDSITVPSGTDDYHCSFFHIPSGVSATGTGDVLVYTYECTSTPPPNSAYAWYFQNCTTRQNGAGFVLSAPDADIESIAGDTINGAVTMRGLEPGDYSLTGTEPLPNEETSAVYCAEIGKVEIPGPAQMMVQEVSDNSISAPVTADKLFYCQWYHVPTDPASTPVP